jgi:hypothetical protein
MAPTLGDAPTAGDAPTDGPDGAALPDGPDERSPVAAAGPAPVSARRAPMALFTWAFVVLVLVIVVVLLIVKVTRGPAIVPTTSASSAPAEVVREAATVPKTAFDLVGAPTPSGPVPTVLAGQAPLTVDGKPAVVYVGAEFCPYCAAERWALVVAMSRFGHFSHLGATTSSAYEVFPELPTFSFMGTTYTSRYLSFSSTEEYGQALASTAPAGFPGLSPAGSAAQKLMTQYGRTLPFVDIGNRLLAQGADIGFSPGTMQGLSMQQIAADLSVPTSPVAQSVLGAANSLTAGICATTGGKPGPVCRSAGVRAAAGRLGL